MKYTIKRITNTNLSYNLGELEMVEDRVGEYAAILYRYRNGSYKLRILDSILWGSTFLKDVLNATAQD